MRKNIVFPGNLILLTLCFLCASCAINDQHLVDNKQSPALQWKRDVYVMLGDWLQLPVAQRIQKMPEHLLRAIIDSDRSVGINSAGFYTTREPDSQERQLFRIYLELLPVVHKKVFDEKLLAIFLVNDFAGAGYADWVLDENGEVYYYLIFNTALFRYSIDEWLTYKDNSLFNQVLPALEIRVSTGIDYHALLYALLHEGTHLVDYELGITPLVEPLHQQMVGREVTDKPFTQGVWDDQTTPIPEYDFYQRTKLNVYGIFPERGRIPNTEARRMFSELSQTPFGSFYAGSSWNEHLADFFTYFHIERELGGEIQVDLLNEGIRVLNYYPMKIPLAAPLKASMDVFYQ